MDYPQLELRIGGARIGDKSRPHLPVINPATEDFLAALPVANRADLDEAIAAASTAFCSWRDTAPWQRGALLHEAARQVRLRLETMSQTLVLENGKPLTEARAEIAAAADTLDWYAGEARRLYGRSFAGRVSESRFVTAREPVGVVALFSPWNFPAVTLIRKLAPALAAGCSVIAKPAEATPATALLLAACLEAAGLPAGVFNVVYGDPAMISEHLIEAPAVAKISFTGSTAVGRSLASKAGAQLKRMTMELGGHGPAIVCGDIDPLWAADLAAAAKFRNAGQVCNAASRFYVDRRIYEPFVVRFAEAAGKLRLGSGLDPQVDMGPLSNQRRLAAMQEFTTDALRHGARLVTGGSRLDKRGFFFTPTVLADVPPGAKIMLEEPFGPIAPIVPFDSLDEVLGWSNALPYGLAGYVLTQNLHLARTISRDLQVGIVGLNTFAAAFPETPFGGIKNSGWGSEGGSEGIEPYLTTKFIHEA